MRKNHYLCGRMKKMRLIINPISGTDDKHGLARSITERLQAADIDVETSWTECRGDATRLAREAVMAGVDGVLACGGDGTVNETARAMTGTGVPMGIIPAGSGNGLARHLAIPIDPLLSLDIISEGIVTACDYGTANGTPFFCTFGVGFDAAVSDRFANCGGRGKLNYIKSAIEEALTYRTEKYTVETDSGTIVPDALLIACCNASQYGNNAYIAPQASITDGLLDLMVVSGSNLLTRAAVGLEMLAGTLANSQLADVIRVTKATIERENEGPAHVDGEPVMMGRHIDIECHHSGLHLFTPADEHRVVPIITPVEDMLRDARIKINNLLG